jgi:RNA polymerase sigma-70 factor, ECF subfamily
MAVGTAPDTVDPQVVRLVERARKGEADAFAQLYDRYLDQVYGYIRRRVGSTHVAEDLTGDVFLRAWRRFDRFNWQGVDLGAWLITIARNRVHDHFKSARFRRERTTDEVDDSATWSREEQPDAALESEELTQQVRAAMEQLSADHREVLELRFVNDLSVAETAAVLDRTVGATKALQYRALKALAEVLRDTPGMAGFLASGLGSVIMALGLLK